ncbi:MAG: tRNA-dihydrouridine synthase [Clostridia bacterium]|nr:tRNA-dihydrouridine synthase [Clostridia bacterium]
MSLSVDFMGIKLNNPIIAASGSWCRNGEMMKKAVAVGAGAVVTETIVNEIRRNVRPRLVRVDRGVQNIRLYSDFSLEEWEREIYEVKSAGGTVIANILAHSPSEMAYVAGRVERFGADAIELGVASPHGEGVAVLASNPNRVFELTKSVSDKVKIPVMVKMSPSVNNMAEVAVAAEKAGAKAISGIDTVRAIIGVDIQKERPLLPTYGGYSGSPIRPIGLAAIATISQAVDIQVCGVGGIENYKNAIEYMMLGASTVQIGTAVLMNGFGIFEKIIEDLDRWVRESQYQNISEIRGNALTALKSFEEMKVEPYTASLMRECSDSDCQSCLASCMYNAICYDEDKVIIDSNKCTGCGMCVSLCPQKKIEFIWK